LTSAESAHLAGADPDHATRDLFESIATGMFPSWTLYIQVMTFTEAEHFRWNPFDLTKVLLYGEYFCCTFSACILAWMHGIRAGNMASLVVQSRLQGWLQPSVSVGAA